VPWSRVAEWSDQGLHSTALFEDLAQRVDGGRWPGSSPDTGELARSVCAHLAGIFEEFTTTPGESWYCVWFGWGDLAEADEAAVEITKRITHSGRRYFLYRGPVAAVTDLRFPHPTGRGLRSWTPITEPSPTPRGAPTGEGELYHSPSFWWPEDRAWFLSTEVHAESTYIGGSARLIERLLEDPNLEALPARPEDPFDGIHPGMRVRK
jgi:hypothetical protein